MTEFAYGVNLESRQQQLGWAFALYSAQAERVELCLFDELGNERRVEMAKAESTPHSWQAWLTDVTEGTQYGYRLYGEGCNPQKLMLDPYAKFVVGKPNLSCAESCEWFLLNDDRNNGAYAPKGVIKQNEEFDWQQDQSPQIAWGKTIVYELHVKGFSQLKTDLPEQIRGSYAALAHPNSIAYLQDLGVTTIELLPVNYAINEPHLQQKGLHNYWGYNPLAMFALEPNYAATDNPELEFKHMVRALHQAGIEVILDVVFNHSAESEKYYPTFSQRGIDEQSYYWQDQQGNYLNWTGCGNMLNVANPVGRRWLLDCLRYWVQEYHVDGFRFDLASSLGRETPYFNPQAELFALLEQDPILSRCKLISEPWDLGEGGYQVGNFPAYFAEWNDRYRDDMRQFWLWKNGNLGAFAERLAGSSDIYRRDQQLPHKTLNFLTAHDGFTLRDLVSYNHKHNLDNGEDNRDGRDDNFSYNHGIEGICDALPEEQKSAVENQRTFSSLALLRSLLLSNGTPMLLAGDEFGNTQHGNNNAYCQDNHISWLKWQNFDRTLFNACKQAIALRKQIQSLYQDCWWSAENVAWLNLSAQPMQIADWQNPDSKAMQILLDQQWLFLVNAKQQNQHFYLPEGLWIALDAEPQTVYQGEFELAHLGLQIFKRKL